MCRNHFHYNFHFLNIKGLYKVELEDGRVLSLYEEVILKYELLLKREIHLEDLDNIRKYNQEYEVYYVALESIKSRFKSVYDIKELLLKKEYPCDMIDMAIEKLLKQGYLNDRSFAKSYINNQIVTTTKGPNKIKKELLEHRVDSNIIEDELVIFEEEIQLEKIEKVVTKFLKSNHSRGGVVLKRKIINDLVILGYDNYLINRVINQSIDDNGFYNPIRVKIYLTLEIVYAYTNLSFTDKMKEDPFKLYDLVISTGLFHDIITAIEDHEYATIREDVYSTIENIYKYRNSVMGILDTLKSSLISLNLLTIFSSLVISITFLQQVHTKCA